LRDRVRAEPLDEIVARGHDPAVVERVLADVSRMSDPFGTRIRTANGVGVIDVDR